MGKSHCSPFKLTAMEAEKILSADFLDILFENRNKNYGAYDLRVTYEKHVLKALGFMFLLLIVFYIFNLPGKTAPKTDISIPLETVLYKMNTAPVKKTTPPPPKPATPQQSRPTQQTFNSHISITDSNQVVKKINNLTDSSSFGPVDDGKGHGKAIVPCRDCPGDSAVVKTPVTTFKDPSIPRQTADIMPAFPGGMSALRKFLQDNLTTPSSMEEGSVVSVKIRFVVGYDGALKGFEIVEDGGDEYNQEVIRVLKKMPHWIPGKSEGRNVSVFYLIPVSFMSPGQ